MIAVDRGGHHAGVEGRAGVAKGEALVAAGVEKDAGLSRPLCLLRG